MDIADQLVAAEVLWMRGASDEALEHLQALSAQTAPGSIERVRIDILDARLRMVGDRDPHQTLGTGLVEEARRLGDPDTLADAWLVAVEVELARGRFSVAASLLRSAEVLLPQLSAPMRGAVHRQLGRRAWLEGDHPGADYHLSHAMAAFQEANLGLHTAQVMVARARAMATSGRHRLAESLLLDALSRFEAAHIEIESIAVLRALAETAAVDGRSALAVERARDALLRLEQVGGGRPLLQARLLLLVAQCCLADGDLVEAERACVRATAHLEQLRHPDLSTAKAVMAMIVAGRGRSAEAAQRLEASLRQLERRQQHGDRLVLASTLARVQAELGRGPLADQAVELARTLFQRTGRVDADARDQLKATADLAVNAGWQGRAVRALALAQRMDERAGWDDDAVAVGRSLRTLREGGAPVPAGPFELHGVMGTGAMGEVWHARHPRDGSRAAVKVVTADVAADPRRLALVADELAAAAGLDHPHVVRILGHGLLDSAAESMTGGHMRRDTPWIAMELITGGTLQPLCGHLPWRDVHAVLHALLDALAHAHARGVLHLDVKPANVLVTGTDHPTIKLGDFGLSGARTRTATVVGTPATMAPEQFLGRTDALGPHTDLYALGCLTWELVTGAPPFPEASLPELRHAHMSRSPPPLVPRVPVPPELEAWLRVLLRKAPGDRFERAADARWALRRLGPPVALDGSDMPLPERKWRVSTFTLGLLDAEPLPDSPSLQPTTDGPPPAPPVPLRWQGVTDAEPEPSVELFGLRAPRLQGRGRPQGLLWATLRDVSERHQPRLLVVEGLPGVGRSALLDWLQTTAHERGSVDVVTLPDDLSDAVAVSAVDTTIRRHAPRRTQLVRLERDALHDHRGLDLVEGWLQGGTRVLVCAIGAGPGADDRVEALLDRPETLLVELTTLPDDAIRALCASQLPLSPERLDAVVAKAAGHPGLAMALLQELETPGLASPLDGSLAVPTRIVDVWGAHLQAVLAPLAPEAFSALLVAALLGPEVSVEIWHTACRQHHVRQHCEDVEEALIAAGLAQRAGPDRWALTHAALGDVIEQLGERSGALEGAARAAAESLTRSGQEARQAALYLRGDAPEEALHPLATAAEVALADHDGPRARSLLAQRSQILATLGVPEGSPAWLAQCVLEARVDLLEQRWDRARAWAQQALDAGWGLHRPELEGQASLLLGQAAWRGGDLPVARAALDQAIQTLAGADPTGEVAAWTVQARVHAASGDLEQARQALDAGWQAASSLVIESPERLQLALDRARMALATGRPVHLPAGLQEVCEVVSDTLAVDAGVVIAAIERHAGRMDTAAEALDRATPRLSLADRDQVGRLEAARALLELAHGDDDDARARLRQAPPPPTGSAAELAWLALAVSEDDDAWSRRLARSHSSVQRMQTDADAPWVLDLAARRALDLDLPERAAAAWELSSTAWDRLGRAEEAQAAARLAETARRARPLQG